GEAAEIEDADPLAHGLAFLRHRLMPVGAPEARPLLGLLSFAREPGRTLPAAAGAEHGALALEFFVERRVLARAAGGPFVEWEGDGVLVLIELERLLHHIGLGGVVAVAPRIEGPEIPFRLAMGDPFGDGLAGTPRLRDAEAEAAAVVEVPEAVGRADIG